MNDIYFESITLTKEYHLLSIGPDPLDSKLKEGFLLTDSGGVEKGGEGGMRMEKENAT